MEIQKSKSMIHDLTVGSVPKQLIRFAAPLFLSGILQTVYNLVDMIVVGRFCGKAGISAVANGGDIMNFLTFIVFGFSSAGQIVISQFIGANKRDKVSKLIGTMFTFILGCAVVLTILGTTLSGLVVRILRVPAEAREMTRSYMLVCACGLIFIYGYNLISAILRGMGDSKHPFIFVCIAAGLNVVLDLLFVAVFNWNAFGAALATVISQSVSCVSCLIFLYRRKEAFGFDFKRESFGIDKEVFPPLIKLGIPIMIQYASINFSKLFVTSWVNSFGVVGSAVTGVGNKLNMIINTFGTALSTSGASMVAQNIGAEKYKRVPKVMLTSFTIGAIVAVIFGSITLAAPRFVFGLFTSDADVLDMAMQFVPVSMLMFASCALRPPANAIINGSGNSKLNLTIAILDGIVLRIGFDMFLGLVCKWGIKGFWYGNAFASFTPFVIGIIFFMTGRWKTRRHIVGKD